jgi:hypothetical protein
VVTMRVKCGACCPQIHPQNAAVQTRVDRVTQCVIAVHQLLLTQGARANRHNIRVHNFVIAASNREENVPTQQTVGQSCQSDRVHVSCIRFMRNAAQQPFCALVQACN